jgi:hypothetical protein
MVKQMSLMKCTLIFWSLFSANGCQLLPFAVDAAVYLANVHMNYCCLHPKQFLFHS